MGDMIDQDTLRDWIDCCLNSRRRSITAWERSFLESIGDQLDRTGRLSNRQVEILEEIYAKTYL
jgi:hypothetical protein